MKKQIKGFLVGISVLVLGASAFGYLKIANPNELLYKTLVITSDGTKTGDALAYFNRTGENFISGYQTISGMSSYVPFVNTGYFYLTLPSSNFEDDGSSLGIFGNGVALGNNIGSAFSAGYYGLAIATNTGSARFIENRGTGYRVGFQYDYDGNDWSTYVADFTTGTMIPKYMLSRTLANLTNKYVPFYSGGLWYNSKINQTSNTILVNGATYQEGKAMGISGNLVIGTTEGIYTGNSHSLSVGKDNILGANYSLVVGQDNDVVGTGVYFSLIVGFSSIVSDTMYSIALGYKPYINNVNNTFLFAGGSGPKSAYKDKTFIVYADGGMGVETNDPKTTLDVNGMIKIGKLTTACSSTIAGTMKYSGTNFYGCNGSSRVQLDN